MLILATHASYVNYYCRSLQEAFPVMPQGTGELQGHPVPPSASAMRGDRAGSHRCRYCLWKPSVPCREGSSWCNVGGDKRGDRQLITRDPAGPAAHAALLPGLCAEAVSFGPTTGAAQAAWKQSWFSSVHGSTLFGYDRTSKKKQVPPLPLAEFLSSAEAVAAFLMGAGRAAHTSCQPDEPRAVTKGRSSVQPGDIARCEPGCWGGPRTQCVADDSSQCAHLWEAGEAPCASANQPGAQQFSHRF